MLQDQKVVVVLPAYRAHKTLARTVADIPLAIVDEIILVDDASDDDTLRAAQDLGIRTFVHDRNLGYGANQKTCYAQALRAGADIVVMLHPDYQYDPRLVTPMAGMIASGAYDVVIGSRILGNTARQGGMPLYKYIANRGLTAFQNLLMGSKLSEFHSGYRAFSRPVLAALPLYANSDDFVFDNQILTQVIAMGYRIGEISCPTRYFPEASSIGFARSLVYGLGCIGNSIRFRLWRWGFGAPGFLTHESEYRLDSDTR